MLFFMEIRISNLLSYFYLGIFLLIVSSMSLFAQVENRLGLKFYGSFIYSEKVPNALFFFNDIQQNDSFELRKAMRNHEVEILVLSSRGGSVFEGLNIAGIIHDKQLTTYVPKMDLEGGGKCASACAFMFFAGNFRLTICSRMIFPTAPVAPTMASVLIMNSFLGQVFNLCVFGVYSGLKEEKPC